MYLIFLKRIVKSRVGIIGVSAVALLVGVYFFFQNWQDSIVEEERQEQRIEQLERERETREKIDEGIRRSPRDTDSAVDWLRDRQQDRQ